MNRKASLGIELLVLVIAMVVTSAVVLLLVRTGVLAVKSNSEDIPLLNAEFVPFTREGSLVIKEFQFCGLVDDTFQCYDPKETFQVGQPIYFRFVVESTPVKGEVVVVENYRLKGPDGRVLLEVDEKNNFYYQTKSTQKTEVVTFKDYFTVSSTAPAGEYTLELVLENPLLEKKATLTRVFEVGS